MDKIRELVLADINDGAWHGTEVWLSRSLVEQIKYKYIRTILGR